MNSMHCNLVQRQRFYFLLLFVFPTLRVVTAMDGGSVDSAAIESIDSVFHRCVTSQDQSSCLENEAANALARALKYDAIPLGIPGLSLKRTIGETVSSSEATSAGDREGRQADLTAASPYERIWNNLEKILSTRSINFNLAELTEGRGKKKRIYQYIGVALATAAAILIPLKLKLIGWMAASALFVGKLALVVASLIGLKKLVGGKHHDDTTHHVHYDGQRSDDAHYLAYSGQKPAEAMERRSFS